MQRLLTAMFAAMFAAMFTAMFAAMFAVTRCPTDLCLGWLKRGARDVQFVSVERCCRLDPSSAREQHGEQHRGGVSGQRCSRLPAVRKAEALSWQAHRELQFK